MNTVLTVSQINTYVKSLIDYDTNLKNIYVCGEISNFTNHYRTGHFYFTLKDENAAIKAVMFRQYAGNVQFEPYNGLKVLLRASVSVYERDGVYQLYVTDMQPDGMGALNLAFEQLKERLEKEGLFAPELKKPIPPYPEKIAVITSPTGAAVQDIINVISRRYPCCELILLPVQVQGEDSAPQIVSALETANRLDCADVIILGRGGGSIEDLWSFNDEAVARAIFSSRIPIISAVGHETDFTIADFVSDLRAPTPSAAAELAVPDRNTLLSEIDYYSQLQLSLVSGKIAVMKSRLNESENMLRQFSPIVKYESKAEKLAYLKERLTFYALSAVREKRDLLRFLQKQLDSLSPMNILSRGYAIVENENGGQVSGVDGIKENDKLKISFKNGNVLCVVNEVRKNEKRNEA